MPPRIQLLSRAASVSTASSYRPLAPFLYPFLAHRQQRSASILTSLSDIPSAYNKRIRRGRGPSSGKGKTSGRGHKGQKQHGKVPAGFNGGQTSDEVVRGPRGFDNFFSVEMSPVNLEKIQYWIDQGRLDPTQPITLKELNESRCLHGIKDGVKLLARGKEALRTPINIVVSRASAEAIKAVESVGGQVMTRYYTKFAIRKILRGEMNAVESLQSRLHAASGAENVVEVVMQQLREESKIFKYRLPDPTSRKNLEYYRDSAHRGYLSHLVEPGQTPSLFFKTPGTAPKVARKTEGPKAQTGHGKENRLW